MSEMPVSTYKDAIAQPRPQRRDDAGGRRQRNTKEQ